MAENTENFEKYVEQLEKIIQEKLLDCEEFHDICKKLKEENYDVEMGIMALLMNYENNEKGFVSFPFYLEYKDKPGIELSDNDKRFLKDLGISI